MQIRWKGGGCYSSAGSIGRSFFTCLIVIIIAIPTVAAMPSPSNTHVQFALMKLTRHIIPQTTIQRTKYSGILTNQCTARRLPPSLPTAPATVYAIQKAISPSINVMTKSQTGLIGKLNGSFRNSKMAFICIIIPPLPIIEQQFCVVNIVLSNNQYTLSMPIISGHLRHERNEGPEAVSANFSYMHTYGTL